MSKTKSMSDLEIAAKLKAGRKFNIQGRGERARVYWASKFLEISIRTKALTTGGWLVEFIAK